MKAKKKRLRKWLLLEGKVSKAIFHAAGMIIQTGNEGNTSESVFLSFLLLFS